MISYIEAIPAFSDNYIWTLIKDNSAAVVDPGDASPGSTTAAELSFINVQI